MLPRWIRKLALYGLCVLIAAGVVFVLSRVVGTLKPVVLAIAAALLLAALFDPVVEWLHRRRLPRWLSALVAVLGGLIIVVGTFVLVGMAAADEAEELGQRAASGIDEIRNWLVDRPRPLAGAARRA